MPEPLRVGIGLKDRLTKDLRKALGGVRDFTKKAIKRFKSLGKAIFSVKGAIVGLVSGLIVRQLGRLILATTTLDDRFDKLNKRLGLSVEFLSGIKFTGEQAGVEFNSLSVGLQRMIRRLEEFRSTGKGVAATALHNLGGGIAELVKQGADFETVVLPAMADRFKELGSASEAVLQGFQLLDTEGVALIQFLKDGRKAVTDFSEAQRLGLIRTTEQVAASVRFNDALNETKRSLQGLRDQALTPLLPLFERFLKGLTDYVVNNRERVVKFFEDMAERIQGMSFRPLIDALKELGRTLSDLERLLKGVLGLYTKAADFAKALRPPIPTPPPGALGPSVDALSDFGRRLDFRKYSNIPEGGFPTYGPSLEDLMKGREGKAPAAKSVEETTKAVQKLNPALAGTRLALQQIALQGSVFQVMRVGVAGLAGSITSNLSTGMTDLISGTKTLKEAFKNTASAMLRDITSLITRMIVLRTISGFLGFAGFGAFAAGPALTGVKQEIGIPSVQVPGAQFGARFSGPQSGYIAKLHGTEDVSVTPLWKKSPGEGQGVNVQVIIQAIDAQSFERRTEDWFARNTEVVLAVARQKMRDMPQLTGQGMRF